MVGAAPSMPSACLAVQCYIKRVSVDNNACLSCCIPPMRVSIVVPPRSCRRVVIPIEISMPKRIVPPVTQSCGTPRANFPSGGRIVGRRIARAGMKLALQDVLTCISWHPSLRFRLADRVRSRCCWLNSVPTIMHHKPAGAHGIGMQLAHRQVVVVRLLPSALVQPHHDGRS